MSGAQFYCRSVNGGDYAADSREHAAELVEVYAPAIVVAECPACGDRGEPEWACIECRRAVYGGDGVGHAPASPYPLAGCTYYESAIGVEISRRRALGLLAEHGIVGGDVRDFDDEIGVFDSYLATTVLDWLGY